MIYCFDTSALNQLRDDADHRPLVAGLLAAHSVYVTAVNCLEVLGTKDENRRNLLQLVSRELACGQAPLALPIDLLKLLTIVYGADRDRRTFQIFARTIRSRFDKARRT
jgi:predicted nucleic acid-binding protein